VGVTVQWLEGWTAKPAVRGLKPRPRQRDVWIFTLN